jgi:hypothetical protein
LCFTGINSFRRPTNFATSFEDKVEESTDQGANLPPGVAGEEEDREEGGEEEGGAQVKGGEVREIERKIIPFPLTGKDISPPRRISRTPRAILGDALEDFGVVEDRSRRTGAIRVNLFHLLR